ncbi:hypothetical protein Droror1_Dr00023617, partial [Drosera rotundifolia]
MRHSASFIFSSAIFSAVHLLPPNQISNFKSPQILLSFTFLSLQPSSLPLSSHSSRAPLLHLHHHNVHLHPPITAGLINAVTFTVIAERTNPGQVPGSFMPDVEDRGNALHEIKRKVGDLGVGFANFAWILMGFGYFDLIVLGFWTRIPPVTGLHRMSVLYVRGVAVIDGPIVVVAVVSVDSVWRGPSSFWEEPEIILPHLYSIKLGDALDEIHAGLLPEQKAAIIQGYKNKVGPTAVVGDGVNGAPALATTDIGISIGISGSALAKETGHVVLMSTDIRKIPKAIHLAKRIDRKVLNVGKELYRETLPLRMGSRLYKFEGFKPSAWYELKISYAAFIPAIFSMVLKRDDTDVEFNTHRKLLNTEKLFFKAESSDMNTHQGGMYVLVTVELEGIVAIPGVPEREEILFNI